MIDLGALKIGIQVDNQDADKQLDTLGQSTEKAGGKLKGLLDKAKKAAVIGGIGVVAKKAFDGVVKLAQGVMDTTDRVDKLSQKIGVSKESFQEWDYVCNQSGVDVTVFQNGMKTLITQMDAAANGSATATAAFDALGVSWEDDTGKLKSQEQMMNEAITALSAMEDGTERARLSTELFGRAGTELAPILNTGAEGIDALKQNAHDLGLVMSDETITAGVVLGDTMADVKAAFGAVATKIGAQLMPVIQKVLDWVILHMPEIQAIFQKVFNAIGDVIEFIKPLIMGLINVFKGLVDNAQTQGTLLNVVWETIKSTVKTAIDFIKDVFEIFSLALNGDWEECWNKVKETLNKLGDSLKQIGKKILNSLWDGIKEVWKGIKSWFDEKIQWIKDKFSWIAGKQNKANSTDFGMQGNTNRIGLNEVPYDGYSAILHKGEMVLTAAETNQYQKMLNGGFGAITNQLMQMQQGNNTVPANIVVQIGEERIAEKMVKLQDEARIRMGTQKAVTVSV